MKKIEYVGKKFSMLFVLSELPPLVQPSGQTKRNFLFRCDCGNEKSICISNVIYGNTKSCGCLKEKSVKTQSIKHGCTSNSMPTKEYRAWVSMKERCYNVNNADFKNYGGRGIKVCDRWFNSFENFLEDMGAKPTMQHSLDRIKNNGNYEPSNCRWATPKEQQNNRSNNKYILYNSIYKTRSDWALHLGLSKSNLCQLLYKYDFETIYKKYIELAKSKTK